MPKRSTCLTIIWFFCMQWVASQGIQDSVFAIEMVEIRTGKIFIKEEAGMKKYKVDSLVMADKATLSLSELLSENTNIYIKDYGRGALATASFRGTAPSHTQVTWNGININSPMLGMTDFSLLPVYLMDEVELHHGGASVRENGGGLGGQVSLRSTVDWQNRFSGRYYQGLGSFKSFDEFGQINLGNESIQSQTRLYHNYSRNDYPLLNTQIKDSIDGQFTFPEERNRDAEYRKYGLQQELYFRPAINIHTSAKIWYQDARRNIPNVLSYEGSSTSFRKNQQDERSLKSVLQGTYYGKDYRLNLRSGVDYQDLDYVVNIRHSGQQLIRPVNTGSRMFSNYNHAGFDRDGDKLNISVRGDANYFDISTLDTASQTGYHEERMEYSLFTGFYFSPFEKMNLLAELRKDWVPGSSSPLIYNVGISLKPFEGEDLELKGAFTRNFHYPGLNDLYWQPGGNPDLLPEEGHTMEAGIHVLKTFGRVMTDLEITAYHSDINNWILWVPGIRGYWEAMNLANVLSRGMEVNARIRLKTGWLDVYLNGNYAFTRTTSTDPVNELRGTNGNQLPFIPLHSGNILAGLGIGDYYLSYQYHFYGERNLINSELDQPDEFPYYRLYAHHLNNLSLGKTFRLDTFTPGIEVRINNLFNESYRNVLNRFMPRRHYTLLLKFSF